MVVQVKRSHKGDFKEMQIEELSKILAVSSDDYHEKITGKCKFYMDVDYKTCKENKEKFTYHDALNEGENYKKLEPLILKIIMQKLYEKFDSQGFLTRFQVCSSSAKGIISLHITSDIIFEDGIAIKQFLSDIDFGKVRCMIDLNPYKEAGKIQCMRVVYSVKDGRKLVPISFPMNGNIIESSKEVADHLITYNCDEIVIFKKAIVKKELPKVEAKLERSDSYYDEIAELLELFPSEWYDDRLKRLIVIWALANEEQSTKMEDVAWMFYNKYKSKEAMSIKKEEFHRAFWKDFRKDQVKSTWDKLCKDNLKIEDLEDIKTKYQPDYKEKQKKLEEDEKMKSYRAFEDTDNNYCWQEFLTEVEEDKLSNKDKFYEKAHQVIKFIRYEIDAVLVKVKKNQEVKYEVHFWAKFKVANANIMVNVQTKDEKIGLKLVNLLEEKRSSYNDLVFDPSGKSPAYVFNYFTGFKAKKVSELDMKKCDKIIEHIYNLCGTEKKDGDYAIKQFAAMVQYPHIKTGICMIFVSGEGSGKSMLMKMFMNNIFGKKYSTEICDMDEIIQKFNAKMENKLFVVADEAIKFDEGKYEKSISKFKSKITNETISLEKKGKDGIEVADCSRYIITTNAKHPIVINDSQRRFVQFKTEMKNIIKTKPEYNKSVRSQLDNQDCCDHFFTYLMKMEINLDELMVKNITESMKEEIDYHKFRENEILRFIEKMFETNVFEDKQKLEATNIRKYWDNEYERKKPLPDRKIAEIKKILSSNKEKQGANGRYIIIDKSHITDYVSKNYDNYQMFAE